MEVWRLTNPRVISPRQPGRLITQLAPSPPSPSSHRHLCHLSECTAHRARPTLSLGVVSAAPCHCPLSPRTARQHFQPPIAARLALPNPDSRHAARPALSVICPPLPLRCTHKTAARQAAPCCTMHHSEGCLGAPSLFCTATCPTHRNVSPCQPACQPPCAPSSPSLPLLLIA